MSFFPPGRLVTSRVAEFVWYDSSARPTDECPPGADLFRSSDLAPASRVVTSGRSVSHHHRRRGLRPWRRHGRALGAGPRSCPPACLASDRTPTPRQAGRAAQPRALSRGSSRPPSITPVWAAGPVRVDSAVRRVGHRAERAASSNADPRRPQSRAAHPIRPGRLASPGRGAVRRADERRHMGTENAARPPGTPCEAQARMAPSTVLVA